MFLSTLQISGFWDWRERLSPFSRPLCSECNSNRDSVLSYTSVRSNSSYLGSDEMGSGECDGGAGGGTASAAGTLFIVVCSCVPALLLTQ